MKIGIFTTGFFSVNKEATKATEYFTYCLAEKLVSRGHDVFLFGAEGSKGSFKVVYPRATKKTLDSVETLHEYDCYVAQNFADFADFCNQNKIDILHEQSSELPVTLARYANMPVVSTLHGDRGLSVLTDFYKDCANIHYVSPSRYLATESKAVNVEKIVPHGIESIKYLFNDKPKNDFISIGRIIPEKGQLDAIKASRLAKEKLVVAGYKPDFSDGKYFNSVIKEIGSAPNTKFVGKVARGDVPKFMSDATALLMPIKWNEAFGLVMIEAMACGTPVIAYDRAAVREIVIDGKTGFVVPPDDIEAMAKAMAKISLIKREDCRRHVEKNFDIEGMVTKYEEFYHELSD